MSQGDIEKRTGLLRCYLSRVENGHTVPSLDTLKKIAGALDLQLARVLRRKHPVSRKRSSALNLNAEEIRFLTQVQRYSAGQSQRLATAACSSRWCASSPQPLSPSLKKPAAKRFSSPRSGARPVLDHSCLFLLE